MKVDIWSDIRCPFCYIGKRRFEKALDQFEHKDQVEVDWHSFELDPSLETNTKISVYDHLAEVKAIPREASLHMHGQVKEMAKEEGLHYDFDQTIVANSFDAHRLIQFAKTKGLGGAAKERLLKAYFSEGKDISDHLTLLQLADSIGLPSKEVIDVLRSDAFAEEVRRDEARARELRINGVPFFVLNNRYGVSGAQQPATFLQALQKAWKEQEEELQVLNTGEACTVNGNC